MIKAVLFDFGGVLTESGGAGFVAETVAELYGVKPLEVRMARLHAELRRGRGDENELFAGLNKKYGKHVTKEMFLQKTHESFVPSLQVYELAKALRAHGIKTAIFSNIFTMNANVLRKEGWYDDFDPIILSCDEGYAKPDPEFYDIAIKRLAVKPQEILLIDDQQKCLEPAAALGMKVITAMAPDQIVADTKAIILAENGIGL